MFEAKVERAIKFRLGLLQKYTYCGGLYWDPKQERFRLTEGYYYYPWHMSYYAGHTFQLLMLGLLYVTIFFDEITEENMPESTKRDYSFYVRIIAGLMIWFVVCTTLAIGSLVIEKREDIVFFLNQAFMLDTKFKQRLVKGVFCMDSESVKIIGRLGVVTQFACYFPLSLPLLFGVSLWQPMDPIHAILVEIFEMEFRPSISIFLLMFAEMWGVFALSGIILSVIISMQVAILFLITWLSITSLPETEVPVMGQRSKHRFMTNGIGRITEDDLVWVCRCLQLFGILCNIVVANRKLAFHAASTLIIMVLALFALIQFNAHILVESVTALGLIFIGATLLVTLIMFVECAIFEVVSGRCEDFRKGVLKTTRRETAVNKTFRSLPLISLKAGYPFFNMNRSAFLEWMNIGMDRLFDLLVTF